MVGWLGAVDAWARDRGLAVAAEPYEEREGRAAATAAGRRAATRALAGLGGPAIAVGDRHDDGRPAWPPGFTGSISHAAGVAVAGVAPLARASSVGIDIEARAALPLGDAAAALGPVERAWAAGRAGPDEAATALWSAKEAAFKAWNERAAGALPAIEPDRHLLVELADDGGVTVTPLAELAGAAAPITGHRWRLGDLLVTLVVSPP